MSFRTLIPAQPGFFAQYPDGTMDPIIAWEIALNPGTLNQDVEAITPEGLAGDAATVVYLAEYIKPGALQ